MTINGFTITNSIYDRVENTYKINEVFATGMCFYFSEWMRNNYISDDTTEDVYNNTSGVRDGCRLDIHDNYNLTDDGRYQISYLYALENGIIYAAVYDAEENCYIGDIEIKA